MNKEILSELNKMKFFLHYKPGQVLSEQMIFEQNVAEFYGGTNANKVTHGYLSQEYGLPEGAKHENFYYLAKIEDVVKQSATKDQKKFLSVFKPTTKYSEDPKGYYDYIGVNNEKLQNSGEKTFRFVNGYVSASHNGLLALVRAMDNMQGQSGFLTIYLGTEKGKTKEAGEQRKGGGVIYNSQSAMDQTPSMNGIAEEIVALAINPSFRKKISLINVENDFSDEQILQVLKRDIDSTIDGRSGFLLNNLDSKKMIQNMIPKGFNTSIEVDYNSIASQLKPLQSIPDLGVYDNRYNEEKRKKLSSVGAPIMKSLAEEMKKVYITNFEIFLKTYLPMNANQIIPTLKDVKFPAVDLGYEHYSIYHRRAGGSGSGQSTLSTTQKKYGEG